MLVLDNFCARHKITFHYEITHCLCISFLKNISPGKKAFVKEFEIKLGNLLLNTALIPCDFGKVTV